VQAVDSAPEVVAGDQPPMDDVALLLVSSEALELAESIEILANEAVVRVRADLTAEAEQAVLEQRELQGFVLGLATVTVLLTLAILRSLLGPLRSLTRRARSLAEGRLEDHISRINGRDELTRLASTIEDVASGLRHLDRQVRAIADGDLDDPSLDQAAPGPVGAYVQERVEALRDASGALLAEAGTDALTGLLNRRGLVDTLQSQDAGRRRSDPRRRRAIVFVDLDKFKAVNDDFGHKHGDAVLIAVARRLEQFVRANDLVARLGGDEFVLVSDGFDPQSVHLLLERVEAHLTQPIPFEGVTHHVGCSVGMAWLDLNADLDAAIDVADRRMLEVKVERGSARR
jgi:diguanylate cyclase (GGDEF)-like protein